MKAFHLTSSRSLWTASTAEIFRSIRKTCLKFFQPQTHLQARNVLQRCDFLLTEIIQSARFDVQMYRRVWAITDKHSLREGKEAVDHKMASMYTDVSESGEFLSNIDADQLLSPLSRDGLHASLETFTFKSVML